MGQWDSTQNNAAISADYSQLGLQSLMLKKEKKTQVIITLLQLLNNLYFIYQKVSGIQFGSQYKKNLNLYSCTNGRLVFLLGRFPR